MTHQSASVAQRHKAQRFQAFLSYSRKDDAAAKWLHAALEAYRTPKDLIGLDGNHGPIPARLSPIFRDRTDLESGGVLRERLVDALHRSEWLLVLCSPASAQSAYVDAEVQTFIEAGRTARILPVIVADTVGQDPQKDERLPPSLRALGLLAADLRDVRGRHGQRIGDGKEGAKFKLIARMLGVPLDTLLQRERKREARRSGFAAVISLVFLVLAVAAGAAAYVAYENEQEARRQTQAAQASADFLVSTFEIANPSTDNPDTITARTILNRGAARVRNQFGDQPATKIRLLDVMGRALNHLGMSQEAQSLLSDHASLMHELNSDGVPALLTLAESYRLQGRFDMALETTQSAFAQVKARPDSPRLFGRVEEARALILHDLGRTEEAMSVWLSAVTYLAHSGDDDRLARVLTNQAATLTDLGRYAEAAVSLQRASEMFATTPGRRSFEFGQSLGRLADNAYAAHDYINAEQYINQARVILDSVLDPTNPTVGDVSLLAGQIYTELGRHEEAAAQLESAITLFTRAYPNAHPALASAYYYLADLRMRQSRFKEALETFTLAFDVMKASLGDSHPNVGALRVQRAVALRATGDIQQSRKECDLGLGIIAESVGANAPMYIEARKLCDVNDKN